MTTIQLGTIEQQPRGVVLDDTPDGIQRVRIERSDLAMVPFRNGEYSTSAGGTGTASYNRGGMPANGDGTGSGFFVQVPAGLNNSYKIRFLMRGRVLGLRWMPGVGGANGGTVMDFGVLIDGLPYTVSNTVIAWDTNTDPAIQSHMLSAIIADDLNDGLHVVDLVFASPSSGTAKWNIYGYLAERRAGYVDPPRVTSLGTTTAVPLVAGVAVIPAPNNANIGTRAIYYMNPTGADITVTLRFNGTDFYSLVVPAGKSNLFQFAGPMAHLYNSSGMQHYASATGVLATVEVQL